MHNIEETRIPYKSEKFILLYYLLLLVMVVFRTSDSEPSAIYRGIYLTAFFIPILFKYRTLYPALLICFTTIGQNGFSYSVFPYSYEIYLIITLIGAFLSKKKKTSIPPIFFLVFIYILFINYFTSFSFPDIVYSYAIVLLFVFYKKQNDKSYVNNFLYCFCVISLSISLVFLFNYESFLKTYGAIEDEVERSGWTDPNYLSCILGMGVITALIQLLNSSHNKVFIKILCVVTIMLSFMSQVLLASRGGILAVSIASIILIFSSKIKNQYRIAIILVICIFLYFLYTNQYFELLVYRVEHDDGAGSERAFIWAARMQAYKNFNFIELLFGVGNTMSYHLGEYRDGIGFHNDFIAVLCQYGFVGLILFLTLLYLPIRLCNKKNRPTIMSMIVYLILVCLTLEPFTTGRLVYFGFYFMIIFMAKYSTYENNSKDSENEKHTICNPFF